MSTCAEFSISEFSACIIFALLLIFNIMYFLKKFKKNVCRLIYFLRKGDTMTWWCNSFVTKHMHGHLCNERVYLLACSTLFDDENNLMSCLSLKKLTLHISFLDIFFSRRLLYLEIVQNWIWHLLKFRSSNRIDFIVNHTLHCYKVIEWMSDSFSLYFSILHLICFCSLEFLSLYIW